MRFLAYIFASFAFFSCAHQKDTKHQVYVEHEENLLRPYYTVNPAVKHYVNKAAAYVIFPRIEKGAVGVGGAYGKGKVYEKSPAGFVLVGTAELTQISAGLQLGGQSYSEIIFFETKKAFNHFKEGETQLNANASAVILKKGKAVNAVFKDGVAAVILKEKGLMGELAVGGQKLTFHPLVK